MAENIEVKVGIAVPPLNVEKLIPRPALWSPSLISVKRKRRAMSGVSAWSQNVGIAVGIMSPAHCVQLVLPLPVSVAAIFISVVGHHREMLVNVESILSTSGLVENMGLTVDIPSLSQPVQNLLPLPFLRPPS